MKRTLQLLTFLIPLISISQTGERWYFHIDKNNLALRGYDATTYFGKSSDDQKEIPLKGEVEISYEYKGVTYLFASKANQNKFAKNPEKYLPQYGGWCAYRMAHKPKEEGYGQSRIPASPLSYKVIDDKLYLFSVTNQGNTLDRWEARNESELIQRGDDFWQSRERLASLADGKPEGLNVNARMENMLWERFMGSWNGQGRQMIDTVNKTYFDFAPAIWTFYYGYDGFCIQDDWKTEQNWGGTGNGPAIRGYDPLNQEWHMTFIPINGPRSSTWLMTGKFDENMELEGYFEGVDWQGRPIHQKIYFFNITENHFSWKADRSYDGGKTWIKKFTYTECDRIQ